MKAYPRRSLLPLAAGLALVYLIVMLTTGALPQNRQFIKTEANGVLVSAPETITRVTIVTTGKPLIFLRRQQSWSEQDRDATLSTAAAEHLDRAVKMMHTANPVRVLSAQEIGQTGLQEFGLASPLLSVQLASIGGVELEADFGSHNSDGFLQYMRLKDRSELYLMSNFVGREWQSVVEQMRSP